MGVGTIIAALIGAGTSIYAGEKQNEATQQAGIEARRLGAQQRQDVLAQNRANLDLSKQQLSQQGALQREQMALSERMQTTQLNQQLARDISGRQSEQYSRALGIINSNTQLKNRLRSLFGGS